MINKNMIGKNIQPRSLLHSLWSENQEDRIEALTELVIALLMEVEALRSVHLEACRQTNVSAKDSLYGKAYYETALLTHNSAGPSGGIEKLFSRYVGYSGSQSIFYPIDKSKLRELVMLGRLDFTAEEIEKYNDEVEFVGTLT